MSDKPKKNTMWYSLFMTAVSMMLIWDIYWISGKNMEYAYMTGIGIIIFILSSIRYNQNNQDIKLKIRILDYGKKRLYKRR